MEKIEENVIVLDYLPEGRGGRPPFRREPLAIVMGMNYFTLLEVVTKKDDAGNYIKLNMNEHAYIGKGERNKIHFIKRRISFDELTAVAQSEVEVAVRDIVKEQEKRFVDFFNKSQPLTTRQHQLELLPKIGKKLMWELLAERGKKPFEGFADIKARVKNMPDPSEIIIEKIMEEIRGLSKYFIFSANPPQKDEQEGFGQHNDRGGYRRGPPRRRPPA
ncbi:MAG: DUF655 domain-containing protein [archaeon]